MEKLEPKYVACYLPYGLKMAYIIGDEIIKVGVFNHINMNNSETHSFRLSIDNLYDLEYEWMFKPILHPLSDLTKEIEVDGESFVPVEEWSWGRFEEISTLKPSTLRFIQLREYEMLIENHFDVFGLIEKGLALSYNDL